MTNKWIIVSGEGDNIMIWGLSHIRILGIGDDYINTLFKASFIFAGIEDEVLLIGFADDEFETQEYLLLQKSLIHEESNFFNQIHITVNSEERSGYGGVIGIKLGKTTISITLTEDTAQTLEVSNIINIEVEMNQEKYQLLNDHFNKLIEGNELIFEVID